MAICDNSLFHVDVLAIDGVPIAIEESSATITGLAGYENEVSVSATGPDAVKRKKVGRMIKAKLQLKNLKDIKLLSETCSAQITLRDTHSGQRVMFAQAAFAKLGDVGQGSVDIEFIGVSPPQYL